MSGYNIDLVTLYLVLKDNIRTFFTDSLSQLLSHFLYVILVQIEFVGYLPVRQIQGHQIQAMHPDFQRSMVSGKH